MGATYKALQTDFSAGQLDPMTEYNLNSSLKQYGLKTSKNTLHYQNGSVGKRPPFRDCCTVLGAASSQEFHDPYNSHATTMQIDGYTLFVDFEWNYSITDYVSIVWKGKAYRYVPIELEDGTQIDKGSYTLSADIKSICVYKEFILVLFNAETNRSPIEEYSVIQTIKVVQDSSRTCGLKFVVVSDVNTIDGVNYPGKKSDTLYSCMYLAGGRLLLAEGNGLFLSRTRTAILKETESSGAPSWLYDFTLADYKYTFTATRTGGTISVDGLSATVEETFECESATEPGDTITLDQAKEYQTKRTTKFTINGNWPTSASPAGSKTVVTYIENGESGSGVISFSSVRLVDNKEYLTTPDTAPSPDNVSWSTSTLTVDTEELLETPTVYSTHGVELHENDMYSSEIQWISYIGRVIVGTDQAIFIATSQSITPATFDLVIAANIGTSEIQPQVMSNLIIFTSADRKKLYAGIYSDELQGMQFTEASSSARDMFIGLISRFWILEYPFMMIYVTTEDGRLLVCTPTATDSGYNFAWSEWTFLPDRERVSRLFVNKIFHDRGNKLSTDLDLRTPRIYALTSGYKTIYNVSDLASYSYSSYQLLELLYTEPYEYGLTEDVKWQLDAKQEGLKGSNKYGLKVNVPSSYRSIVTSQDKYQCVIKWDKANSDGTYQTEVLKDLTPTAIFGGLYLRYFTQSNYNYGYGTYNLQTFGFNLGSADYWTKFYYRVTIPAQTITYVDAPDISQGVEFRLATNRDTYEYLGESVTINATLSGTNLVIAEDITISFVFDKTSAIDAASNFFVYPLLLFVAEKKYSNNLVVAKNEWVIGLTPASLKVFNQAGLSTNEEISDFLLTYCPEHPMAGGNAGLYLPGYAANKNTTTLTRANWYAMFALLGITDSDEIAEIVSSIEYKYGGYYFPFELYAGVFDASLATNLVMMIYPPTGQGTLFNKSKGEDETFTATIGVPYEMRIGLIQQLLPNNTGTALRSKHSIDKMQLQVFRSLGGSVYAKSKLVRDLLYLVYGKDAYSTGGIDPKTQLPYCYTGLLTVDNPVPNTEDDQIEIVSDEPYPFNLLAVSTKYTITEVN